MVKKYICPQCDYEFATRQSLWKHKQKQRCRGQSAEKNPTHPSPTFVATMACKKKVGENNNSHNITKSFILAATSLRMVSPRHWKH